MRSYNFFRPKPGNFGTQLQTVPVQCGTGGRLFVASSTVYANIPTAAPLNAKCVLQSLTVTAFTAAAGAGAITIQAFKRDNSSTPANKTLTAAFDATATVITTADKQYDIPITNTTASQLTFLPGDTLRLDLVSASTISTQPQLTVTAQWAVIY